MLLARQDDSPPEPPARSADEMQRGRELSVLGSTTQAPLSPSASATPDRHCHGCAKALSAGHPRFSNRKRVVEAAAGIEGKVVADAGSAVVWPNGAQRRHRLGACWNRILAARAKGTATGLRQRAGGVVLQHDVPSPSEGPRRSDAPVNAAKSRQILKNSGFSRALPVREEQMTPAAAIEFLPIAFRLGEAVGDGEDDRGVMA